MTRAWIAFGANLGDRRVTIAQAAGRLATALRAPLTLSPLYETAPMYHVDQPAFLNAVGHVEARLEPIALLDLLHRVEADLGRVRVQRNGPRTLDLDLLAVGERRVDASVLTLPHPRIAERLFVLEPLVALAPTWSHPLSGLTALELRDALVAQGESPPHPITEARVFAP